jgi:hypothetical protein
LKKDSERVRNFINGKMKSKTKIPSTILLFSVFSMCISCGPKKDKIEKYMKDGVEVIVNHLEPYKREGEPTRLYLEKQLTIDTEKESVAATGLTIIAYLGVDSEGNIFFVNDRPQDNYILKFDRNGNFVTSFGRKGQGPGELQGPIYPVVTNQDEVLIMDEGRRKLFFFTKEGDYIKSIPQDAAAAALFPLENGNYLRASEVSDYKGDYILFTLFGYDFKRIKELERLTFPSRREKYSAITTGFFWSITKTHVYFGNEQRGYEINVFDLEGNLVRKIKKDYRKARIPEEYIKEKTESMSEADRQRIYFPEYFPPFQSGFVDDEEKLYVITHEKGSHAGEYICDVFTPEGIFIARAGVPGIIDTEIIFFPPLVKKDLLYSIQEKETGYQELVVYKMRWQ